MIETEHEELQQADFPAFPVVFQQQFQSQLESSSNFPQPTLHTQSNVSDQQIKSLIILTQNIYTHKYPQLFTDSFEDKLYVIEAFIKKYHPLNSNFIEQLRNVIKQLHIVRLSQHKVYLGQLLQNQCHGKGLLLFKNGNIYEGMFENNQRCGKGFYLQFGMGWYEGQFDKDKKCGEGVEVIYKKSIYRGHFWDGLRQEKGLFADVQGNIYIGNWKLGIIHGKGQLKTKTSIYSGTFVNWLKHGFGQQKFQNGDTYKGQYQNGRFDGNGVYNWRTNGATFEGSFRNGLRHGKGKWSLGSTKYNGSYAQGLKQGYGQLYLPSGNFYKGNFIQDKRQGYGEMFWSDGSFYKGEWKNGIQNGKGQIYMEGGQIINGLFENSILVQALPSVYEKQLEVVNFNLNDQYDIKNKNQLAKKKRVFSQAKVAFNQKKKLSKIIQNTKRKSNVGVINSHMYFKSPQKTEHTHGKQCKCVRRLQNFRLRQRKPTKIGDSIIDNEYS